MKLYKVTKTYQYTEDVFVEANDEKEACDLADNIDGDRNYDDHLYDSVAYVIEDLGNE